jgi:CHASE2 domain-containing sensor protein
MVEPVDGGRAASRAFAITAIAIAGFLLSLAPFTSALDDKLLDAEWRLLRKLDVRPAADDVIIVGIDPASVNAIAAPPGLWHEPIGRALARIAAAKPRAIGLDFPLPDRSYDAIHPGLDRVLFAGLAAAVENGPFVVTLSIDPQTRSARRIHTPFLALLGDSRLGIGLTAHDDDGVTRRFSLMIPTEDGGFPTLAGRLCKALSAKCSDGLIDYALGPPFRYVSFYDVLSIEDPMLMKQFFRDRIVLIGETQPYGDRVAVPLNLAGWEPPRGDSPGIIVHAVSLRTALTGAAPQEALRPVILLLVFIAALPFLVRDWRLALATAALCAICAFAGAILALRSGLFVPIAAALETLAVAWAACVILAWRARRPHSRNIQHSS